MTVEDVPLGVGFRLGEYHGTLRVHVGSPQPYRHCQVVALQRETYLLWDKLSLEGRVALLLLCLGKKVAGVHLLLQRRHLKTCPAALQLVKIYNKVCLGGVLAVDNDTYPVADTRTTYHTALLHSFYDIVSHGVTTLTRQKYQHRVGTSVAGKSVECGVAVYLGL